MEAVPLVRHNMIDVDDLECCAIGISDVQDHGGEAGEGVVGAELDCVCLEECLVGVDGDLVESVINLCSMICLIFR